MSTEYTPSYDNGLRGSSFLRAAVDHLTGYQVLSLPSIWIDLMSTMLWKMNMRWIASRES